MIFFNDWDKYPSTTKEYNTQVEDSSKEVDTLLKTKVKTGITSPKEAVKTIRTLLMDKDNSGTGNSKLMQIRFLYSFVKLGEKRMEKFITDLFFLAEKRGEGFGPFGKIY